MNQQRGRSRKQQAPNRAPMDSGATYKTQEKPSKPPKRSSRGGNKGNSPTTTPASSPPTSPDLPVTPIIENKPPTPTSKESQPGGASDPEHEVPTSPLHPGASDADADTAHAQPMAAFAAAAAALAAAPGMFAAIQPAAKAVKRKQAPAGAAAAGGNGRGSKKAKAGPSLPLKPGLCSFCGETSSPMWRKGSEQFPRLCNRCGMRWSRNRNDHEKAFSAKVLAKIKAERLRDQMAAELVTDGSGCCSDSFAAPAGPFNPAHPHPASPNPAQQAYAAGAGVMYDPSAGMEVEVAAAAAGFVKEDSNSQDDAEDEVAPGAAAAEDMEVSGRSRSSRARRVTEKAAALQRHAGRGKGARNAAASEALPNRSAFLDLVSALYSEYEELQGASNSQDDSHEQQDSEAEDEGYEDQGVEEEEGGSSTPRGRGRPATATAPNTTFHGPSRLARTTYANSAAANMHAGGAAAAAGGVGFTGRGGLDALMAAAKSAQQASAVNAAQLAGGSAIMTYDSSSLEALAPAERAQLFTQAQQAVAQAQQAAASAHFAAAEQARAGAAAAPPTASLMAQLMQLQAAEQANAAASRAAAGMPAPLNSFFSPSLQQQVRQQQQHAQHQQQALQVLMHQPAALQVVLQQPALLAPAGILLQGHMVNLATPSMPVLSPAQRSPVPQAPVNPTQPAAVASMSPLVNAAAMLDYPQMQQVLQQHQLQALSSQLTADLQAANRPAASGDSNGTGSY